MGVSGGKGGLCVKRGAILLNSYLYFAFKCFRLLFLSNVAWSSVRGTRGGKEIISCLRCGLVFRKRDSMTKDIE